MRVNHRVYIINDVAMPSQFHFPFVIHWNYSAGGMALRALVVTKDIELPVLDYQPRFSLQDYLCHLAPCEVGLVICTALLLACPHSGSGLVRAGHSNSRPIQRQWNTFRRQITSVQEVIESETARRGATGPALSRPKIFPRWVVTACVNYGRVLGLG